MNPIVITCLLDGRFCATGQAAPMDDKALAYASLGVPSWDMIRAQCAMLDPRVKALRPGESVTIDPSKPSQ